MEILLICVIISLLGEFVMFLGVEFMEADGGGISLVHDKWLTPRKTNVWWPPFKNQDTFDRCLKRGESPNENWMLYPISKTYFSESNCDKAKKKIKQAEITSEIPSEVEEDSEPLPKKRIRSQNRRFIPSSSEEDEQPRHSLPSKVTSIPKFLSTPKSICTSLKKNNIRENIRKSSQFTIDSSEEEVSLEQKSTVSTQHKRSQIEHKVTRSVQSAHSSQNNFDEPPLAIHRRFQADNDNSDDFKRLLHQIVYIKKQNDEILNILKTQNNSNNYIRPEIPVELPLQEFQGIVTLEQFLSDNEKLTVLSNYYSTFGGRDVPTKTNNLLKLFLSNSLAIHYSFKGTRNEKRAFENLNLRRLIIGAVLKTTPTASEVDVDNAIKIWLKHARKRLTAKEKRRTE